jgi:hypothetical protein
VPGVADRGERDRGLGAVGGGGHQGASGM